MDYRVRLTAEAVSDAEEAHDWIFDQSPERALKWYEGLLDAINSLETMPGRCPVAPESASLQVEVRQLLYGKRLGIHRVLFHIDEKQKTVTVVRIRHGARLHLSKDELFPDT